MKKKINNPHGIKSPKSVEEFRKNLGKYFWTNGDEGKELYISHINGTSHFIDINKISSFDDIYRMSEELGDKEFPSSWSIPSIVPKLDMKKDLEKFMKETNQVWGLEGYFMDEKNYNLVNNQWDCKDPKWYKIDNHIMREFFMITCGDFSGYMMEVQ